MTGQNRFLFTIFFLLAFSSLSEARPERIKPGLSYFSEGYTTENNLSDIAEEKNYEEVFKNYEFYEAVYDDKKRVKIFKAYKRGDLVSKEEYFYASNNRLVKKVVTDSKNDVKTITFDK
ncbi:MAG: hypothetical protein RQ824_07540 [bacterium]|nr:hypothetical protein [bacterium]